ncbi:MAG: CHAT domain-containing protein, partial [Candidatus Hodarchaeales archaeon]
VLRHNKVMTPMDLQKYRFQNNPLIVFSACESGVSEVKLGDEPFGFLRFTKIMNGQNIIFSLWPVLSKPTTYLMISFYRHILAGVPVADAMRQARVDLITEVNKEDGTLGAYRGLELLYWSPFSFIGMPFYAYEVEGPQ